MKKLGDPPEDILSLFKNVSGKFRGTLPQPAQTPASASLVAAQTPASASLVAGKPAPVAKLQQLLLQNASKNNNGNEKVFPVNVKTEQTELNGGPLGHE